MKKADASQQIANKKWTVIDSIGILMIGAVAGRMLPYYLPTANRWTVMILLGVYALLFVVAHQIPCRLNVLLFPYFIIQTVITLALILAIPSYEGPQDYFVMLLLPLCIQAMWRLTLKAGSIWVGFFACMSAASMIIYYRINESSWEGIGYSLAYVAACIMVAVLSSVTLRAEEAQRESQALNEELRQANQKLQDYARQVEQLAATEERNRLARDLHDSVSQTVFSINLTAQAARILLERDPGKAAAKLEHLQSLTENALAEMRALIQHLRPDSIDQAGLCEYLRKYAVERKKQDGLEVALSITGDQRLPAQVEECLFRVVQESLNNVVKHAGVNKASVTLNLNENLISLCIEDHGAGFDPRKAASGATHLGLLGMQERVRALGGKLEIISSPHAGTQVWVKDLKVKEGDAHV